MSLHLLALTHGIVGSVPAMEHVEETIRSLNAKLDEIGRARRALEVEESEIASIIRGLERHLSLAPRPVIQEPVASAAAAVIERVDSLRRKRKPKNVPSVFRMSCDVLRDSMKRGRPWLDSAEIAEEIRKRWWHQAQTGFIQPQLWRAAKRGRLLKNGARYALPTLNEKTPAEQTAGVSQSLGSEGSAWPATSVPTGGTAGSASVSPDFRPFNPLKEEGPHGSAIHS